MRDVGHDKNGLLNKENRVHRVPRQDELALTKFILMGPFGLSLYLPGGS